ncbi:MAG: hypothetical protein H6728_03090 [Myxococcales bacterium]|nr:hypothetical protein [Myxococcales bacterium]
MYTNGKSSKAKEWIQGLQVPQRKVLTDAVSAEEFQARETELLAREVELDALYQEMTPAEHAALREMREEIVRLPGGKKLHMILDAPAPALLVRSMPPQELLYNLKEIGLADSAEVLGLAHKEQVTHMLDLDCWNKDHVDLEQLTVWLQFLLADEFDAAEQVMRAMDIETLIFYFQKLLVVHNTGEEEAPEDFDGERIVTPFNYYTIDIPFEDTDPMMPLARAAVKLFEQYGYDFCHRLFESIRWSLPSDLEEQSYQFHKGRMEDLGFVDYYEAISLYQPLPKQTPPYPASMKPEGMELPMLSSSESFVGRLGAVVRLLEDEQVERLRFEMVFLHNKVIAAEQLEAGDPRVLERVMRFVQQMLELGLETTCGDDVERGAELLREHHVEWLFRVGFSEVLRLKKRASSLVREEGLTLFDRKKPFSLLPTHFQRFLSDLRLQNPRLYLGGIQAGTTVSRAFRDLGEVKRASEVLDYIAFLPKLFFEYFGFSRGALVVLSEQFTAPAAAEDIRYSHLFLTAWAQRLLHGAFKLSPLQKEDILPFLRRVFVEDSAIPHPLREEVLQDLRDEFAQHPEISEEQQAYVERFLLETIAFLKEEAAGISLDKELDPRFFQLFLLA